MFADTTVTTGTLVTILVVLGILCAIVWLVRALR
jgi:hypothetical protein